MITKKALKNYLNTGATLDRNGDAVSLSGYQVSFFDGPQVPQNDLNAVLQAVNEFLNACPVGAFVGLWLNPETGCVCVDYSENLERLADAMRLGIERKQNCVYDWIFDRYIKTAND